MSRKKSKGRGYHGDTQGHKLCGMGKKVPWADKYKDKNYKPQVDKGTINRLDELRDKRSKAADDRKLSEKVSTLDHDDAQYLQKHAKALAAGLPDPGTLFIFDHVREAIGWGMWCKLHQRNLIHKHAQHINVAGIGNPEASGYADSHVCEVPQRVHERITAVADRLPAHPCDADGHRGVRTVDADAGVYTCTTDDCDRTFDRGTAEAILGGGGDE